MTTVQTFYCPDCGRPLIGVPGTAAQCTKCSRVVNLPGAGSAPALRVAQQGRRRMGTRVVVLLAAVMIAVALAGMTMVHVEGPSPVFQSDYRYSSSVEYPPRSTGIRVQDRLATIWVAMQRYKARHGEVWPASLAVLVREGDISPDTLADPALGDTPAPGSTLDEIASQLDSGRHLSFVYLPPADHIGVLVYERPTASALPQWALMSDGKVEQIKVNQPAAAGR